MQTSHSVVDEPQRTARETRCWARVQRCSLLPNEPEYDNSYPAHIGPSVRLPHHKIGTLKPKPTRCARKPDPKLGANTPVVDYYVRVGGRQGYPVVKQA